MNLRDKLLDQARIAKTAAEEAASKAGDMATSGSQAALKAVKEGSDAVRTGASDVLEGKTLDKVAGGAAKMAVKGAFFLGRRAVDPLTPVTNVLLGDKADEVHGQLDAAAKSVESALSENLSDKVSGGLKMLGKVVKPNK